MKNSDPDDAAAPGIRVAIDGMLLTRHFSGVETSILNLSRALARLGRDQCTLFVPREFEEDEITGRRFATNTRNVPATRRVARIVWEQCVLPGILKSGRFDVLHAPGYLAPLCASTPVVLNVYDLIAIQFPQWCRLTNRINYRLLLPPSVRKAAAVIVPSQCVARDVGTVFPQAAGKTHVVPLGVDRAFRPVRVESREEALRRKHNLGGGFLLFVGNREPKKNLGALVDAFRLLKEAGGVLQKLVFVGGKEWGCRGLYAQIRTCGLADEIIFAGYASEDDLVSWYNMADVMVMPSLYEGFGLPPLEAMACGVPVVCSNSGALPEVVGDAALTVAPSDTGALANALRQVLRDAALRRTLVGRGLERAARFSWDAAAEGVARVYRTVAGRDGSSGGAP